MRKLTIIDSSGAVAVEYHKTAKLELLQSIVGGYIQQVPHFVKFEGRKCNAWCNEEGRINGLPFNKKATELWQNQLGDGPFWYDPIICGTLVIDQVDKK